MMDQGSTIVRTCTCPDNQPLMVLAKTSSCLLVVNQALCEVRCVHSWAFKETKEATPESKAYAEYMLTFKHIQQRILKWMLGSQINTLGGTIL
jgi:hypothetical protein